MTTPPKILIGIPVYNESAYVEDVLSRVRAFGHDVLVVDDGSTDDTPMLLARLSPQAPPREFLANC